MAHVYSSSLSYKINNMRPIRNVDHNIVNIFDLLEKKLSISCFLIKKYVQNLINFVVNIT